MWNTVENLYLFTPILHWFQTAWFQTCGIFGKGSLKLQEDSRYVQFLLEPIVHHRGTEAKYQRIGPFEPKEQSQFEPILSKLSYTKPFKVKFCFKLYVFARFDQYSLSFGGAWCSSRTIRFPNIPVTVTKSWPSLCFECKTFTTLSSRKPRGKL